MLISSDQPVVRVSYQIDRSISGNSNSEAYLYVTINKKTGNVRRNPREVLTG